MSSVHNSVETVNAAATAIVTADSRAQPSTVQKRRWGSCWSIYSCFGSYKQGKIKISPATLLSKPPIPENRNYSSNASSIVLPFIAPPSSPASFVQSDPPSATYSPVGPCPGPTMIFTIGPYAHETQLVSPPVFSAFTTEPSTASFTPQVTTPSSPEVPLAELLSSPLGQKRRDRGPHLKCLLSQYEYRPYQYSGSPGSRFKSPGSTVLASGTSSPFPDGRGAPKILLGSEIYSKWDSRVGSGSLTPKEWGSRTGSGALTPNSGDNKVVENRAYKVANTVCRSQKDDLVDHRVSFELFGEDIPACIVQAPLLKNATGYYLNGERVEGANKKDLDLTSNSEDSFREHLDVENMTKEDFHQKHRTFSLGSSKDFNFNNAKGEVSEKASVDCEWWTNEKVVRRELGQRNSWSFFPMLQSEASCC
ncbi:hypothetical protein OROHE_025101 [Orobanche hederae]